jgi:aryl-alcohol dehydrogenase-like predicted oxidoreductase
VNESLIADALHPYPAGLVIATKGGFDRPGPHQWHANGRPERLREALDGSLRRLRLERIDLYQLHRIDPVVPEGDQFGFLQEAQREGKVRHIGLSEVDIAQIERARQFFPVTSVQNRYNLVDRQWEAEIDYCERERIAFMPWYPLQAGQITEQRSLKDIAKRHGATPSQIALAWLLRRASVMLPIPGTSRRDHLEENVSAAAIKLTDDEYARLRDL